jgi:hypothetical protein
MLSNSRIVEKVSMTNIRIIAIDPSTHAVVPKVPTDDMCALAQELRSYPRSGIYSGMVSAAPSPPSLAAVKGLEWECIYEGADMFWRAGPAPFHFQLWVGTGGKWMVSSGAVGMYEFCGAFATDTEAKAACQAEFNRLVCECLAGRV